jgi:hypothetical protein
MAPATAARAQDPARTVTVFVHGFERAGAARQGAFGLDEREPLVDSVAALAGLPVADGGAPLPPSAIGMTGYYGDTPPAYYTPTDVAELGQVTAQWGGGVPRYALIVAKYARWLLQRSGAQQVNFVSASFGSLIVRWLIEKDAGGLASAGRIARWLSIEGILGGNWAASRDELKGYLEAVSPLPVDVDHMHHDWVATHLHAPRTEADHPHYAGILIGQMVSTDDGYNGGALSALMAAEGEWQPNDGVQAVADARFQNTTARSRLLGLPPMLGWYRSDHFSIQRHRGAWAQAAAFLAQRRRVTVVMTGATVADLHEPDAWYWDWRPAEVVLECRVFSPAVEARWGIRDAVSTRRREGAVAPLRRFARDGETQGFTHVLFDDLVLAEETELHVELGAGEADYDARYGVYETLQTPYYDELGSGLIAVSTLVPGAYAFQTGSWSGTLEVTLHDYPFGPPVSAPAGAPASSGAALRVLPNPHGRSVRITLEAPEPPPASGTAALEILDLAGRRVRRLTGDARAGLVWDGRDEAGAPLPAGVYVHQLVTARGAWSARSVLVPR